MKTYEERLQAANQLLAPCAVPHDGGLGRETPETEDESRFPLQRDRDRIIHSQAFRRLQGKTQVFVLGEESDHVRTRLTHTMEVAQIGRDMARRLSLNEDLAESIALAHDLGHPPFGHRGEAALDEWMRRHGSHFEHNEQSLRIVTMLETHAGNMRGLNLNREILEGLQKHREGDGHPRALSLEAQIVNLADEIAYTGHDCDDGLHAGLFTLEDALGVSLAREAHDQTRERGTSLRGGIIRLLVTDLYAETQRRVEKHWVESLDDVYAAKEPLVGFSQEVQTRLADMRAFMHRRMYSHPRVMAAGDDGHRIVLTLCETLLRNPNDKILALQKYTGCTLEDAIKDYVAGMTDAFAQTQAEELGAR